MDFNNDWFCCIKFHSSNAMLCCVMLCCAMLCCAMLCCALCFPLCDIIFAQLAFPLNDVIFHLHWDYLTYISIFIGGKAYFTCQTIRVTLHNPVRFEK